MTSPPPSGRGSTAVAAVRYGLPAVLILVGFGFLIVRRDSLGLEMWAMLVGAGLSVLLINVLLRIGNRGEAERHAEDEAREYLRVHGRWPDDPPRE